jgi:hypothetical protein
MNGADRPLTVSVLGSCRVHNPVRSLRSRQRIFLNEGDMNAYAHQTGDILQQLLIREGQLTIPQPFDAVVFDQPVPEEEQQKILSKVAPSKVDIAVIELCTVKEFTYKGIYFQGNHLARHITDHFRTPEDAAAWWEELKRADRNQDLIDSLVPSSLHPELQETARHLRMTVQTPENIIAGMKQIAAVIGVPILWVSHNQLPIADGTHIAQREVLMNAMKRGVAELGHGFLDPTPYIETFGVEKAMEPNNPNEYTPEFIGALGAILHFSIHETYNQNSMRQAAGSG